MGRRREEETRRERWLPREAPFGRGGAFPEVNVVQFPCGMGWCERNDAVGCREGEGEAAPGCLEMGFETLSETAARRAFDEESDDARVRRVSRARSSVRAESGGVDGEREDWRSMCARVGGLEKSERVRRVRNIGADALEARSSRGGRARRRRRRWERLGDVDVGEVQV